MSESTVGADGEKSSQPDDAATVLEAHDLKKYFPVAEGIVGSLLRRGDEHVRAVDGVSLALQENETLGLVGESGCGKSTLARTLLRLEEPTAGTVEFQGRDVTVATDRSLREIRGEIQFIHQDPSSSLNPRKRIGQILRRPLDIHADLDANMTQKRVADMLERVGLDSSQRHRYPHEISGGQRQRVEIARALIVNPSVVIADEPTSALDVTVQAQILELLEELRHEFDLSMLFISHDLRTVRFIADRVGVMYLGRLVEVGPTDVVFENARHPYTQALLSSVPSVSSDQRDRITLAGEPPDPISPPTGCRFHPRCPLADDRCASDVPAEHAVGSEHSHRCHFGDADIHTGHADEPAGGDNDA